MTHLLRALVLVPLIAAAGCGTTSVDDDALSAPAPAPDGLVVQVSRTGGFLPAGAAFSTLPAVSVYGDGRVITPGVQIAVYPGPALPSVQVGQLDPERVRELVEDGRAALGEEVDPGQPPVADAPTTVVVVADGEQQLVARALALAEVDTGPGAAAPDGLTPEQQEARERLRAYVTEVEAAAATPTTEPYEAQQVAVLAMPAGQRAPSAGREQPVVSWTGPPLTGGEVVGTSRCLVLGGEEVTQVLRAAGGATQETLWTAGGDVWQLAFRPLLPHEQTCADVLEAQGPASA